MVDLNATARGVLPEHKLKQNLARSEWGEAYIDHDLVFAEDDGRPYLTERIGKTFNQMVEEAGVRRIRLHDLRDYSRHVFTSAGRSGAGGGRADGRYGPAAAT